MPSDRYQFGDFTIDIARASLTCAGAAVALRPKSFALLEYLVTHPGRLVTKDELLAAVWAGVVVTDDSLTRCISDLRSALGDKHQSTIKTVSRRGYLFDAVVAERDGAQSIEAPTSSEGAGLAVPIRRSRNWWLTLPTMVLLAALAGLTWRHDPGRQFA